MPGERFFPSRNHEHRHSAIAYHTPANVHYGPRSFVADALSCSTRPTPPTRSASYANCRGRRRCSMRWINEPEEAISMAD